MVVVPGFSMVGVEDGCAASDQNSTGNQALQMGCGLHDRNELLVSSF